MVDQTEEALGIPSDSDLATPPLAETQEAKDARVKAATSRRPGFRGDGPFDFSGFSSYLQDNVSEEELIAGLDNAGQWMVPFYDAGTNMANVISEYTKPEDERDYAYIKEELGKAGTSAATEGAMWLMGGLATKYGIKGVKALSNKAKQYEIDPNSMSAFGVGSIRKKDTFEEVMTPVKVTKRGTKKTGETILRPSSDLAKDLDPRLNRAMSAETAGSVMPGPGKFFDPSKRGYKGDKFVGMLKDADIELDLEFGNYIMMGKGKPQDVSNETFENLFVSARPSQKKTTFGQNNKSVARANIYDGPSLSIGDMKANYLRNTNKPGVEVRTNLLQPERFSMVTDEGKRALDHPIVAVQSMGGKKDHFYTLDTQFVGPVRMDRLTKKAKRTNKDTGKVTEEVPQPNLRPATVGDINLGEQIGTIKVGKKEHPLYDYIEVDASKSAPEDMGSIPKFNQGGAVMGEQMEMAFGGSVEEIDPVSGNEVPPGSTPKEVRDDIPAMLSEGEYVVPADVTRFYGVKFFEDLRANAKVELADMETNGRIGGEPVPEDEDDLTEDEMALLQEVMAQGEPVAMHQGGAINQQVPYLSPQQPMTNPQLAVDPSKQTGYNQPINMAVGGTVAKDPFGNPIQPVQQSPNQPAYSVLPTNPANPQGIYGVTTAAGTPYTAATPATNRAVVSTTGTPTPTSTTTDTSTSTEGMITKFYINKDCSRISVLMLNGKPISSVPANFNEYLEDTPENSARFGCSISGVGDTTGTTDTDTDIDTDADTVTTGTSVGVDDDNTVENYNVNVKTTVDPDTPDGVRKMYEDSGVNANDPLSGARAVLNDAFKVSKGAGALLSAINPVLGVAGAGVNLVSQLSALSKANANLKMAEFLGKTEDATSIQKEIDDFLKEAPGVVSSLDSVFAKGEERFNNALESSVSQYALEGNVLNVEGLNEVGKENLQDYLGYDYVEVPLTSGGAVATDPNQPSSTASSYTAPSSDDGFNQGFFTPGETTVRPKMRPDSVSDPLSSTQETASEPAQTTRTRPVKDTVTTTTGKAVIVNTNPSTIKDSSGNDTKTEGAVSAGGQYAGDGFEWKRSENGNYLTRTYTGVNKNATGSNDTSTSTSSSTASSSGGYGCYVATALQQKGYWSQTQRLKLIKWCMNSKPEGKLDTLLWRNGYVTFGKRVIAPRVDSSLIQWLSNGFYDSTVLNKKSIQATLGKLFFYVPSYTIGIWKAFRGNLVDIERT